VSSRERRPGARRRRWPARGRSRSRRPDLDTGPAHL